MEHRHPLINRENTVALFWLLFIVPPSMMKDMGSFTKFSIMGVWLIYYLIGLVVVYCVCFYYIILLLFIIAYSCVIILLRIYIMLIGIILNRICGSHFQLYFSHSHRI